MKTADLQRLPLRVPFQDVIDQLANIGILGFDENAPVSYVAGTSTQPDAFKQDLGGPQWGTTATETWAALGATSVPYTPSGLLVPEPDPFAPVALGALGLAALRRRGPVRAARPGATGIDGPHSPPRLRRGRYGSAASVKTGAKPPPGVRMFVVWPR